MTALRTFTAGFTSAFAAEGSVTPDIKAASADVPRVSVRLQAQHVRARQQGGAAFKPKRNETKKRASLQLKILAFSLGAFEVLDWRPVSWEAKQLFPALLSSGIDDSDLIPPALLSCSHSCLAWTDG